MTSMTDDTPNKNPLDMSDDEIKRRQRRRNVAVAWCVVAFVVIVFTVSVVRISAGVQASLGG